MSRDSLYMARMYLNEICTPWLCGQSVYDHHRYFCVLLPVSMTPLVAAKVGGLV